MDGDGLGRIVGTLVDQIPKESVEQSGPKVDTDKALVEEPQVRSMCVVGG